LTASLEILPGECQRIERALIEHHDLDDVRRIDAVSTRKKKTAH
jgi:hypothetical protein